MISDELSNFEAKDGARELMCYLIHVNREIKFIPVHAMKVSRENSSVGPFVHLFIHLFIHS
jgi:hypothetical protein